MKKAFMIGLILLSIYCAGLQAKEDKAFSVELFGGYLFMNPTDLNLLSEYNSGYMNYMYNYYRSWQYDYRQVYINPNIIGGFDSLKQATALGGRLKYTTKSGIALSLALQYQQKSVSSGANFSFSVDDFYQGPYSQIRSISPSQIWVETYVPTLGVHYPLLKGKTVQLKAHLAAGLVLASCGSFEADLSEKQENRGYISSRETIRRLDGTGSGLALEGGLMLQLKLFSSLGLFVEGGYTWQKVGKINGNAYLKSNLKDNNGDGYTQINTWQGDWIVVTNSYGAKPYIAYPGIDPATVSDFSLDLSGFYLRLGISLGLF